MKQHRTLTTVLSEKYGIDVTEVETQKNGISCTGFRINNGSSVSPVVYYSSEETVDELVERILSIANQPTPQIETEDLISKDKLLRNSYLAIQRQGTEELVKRDFCNLELIIRISVVLPDKDSRGSIKVTPQILESSGLSEEELFDAARKNSVRMASISSMAEMLGAPDGLFEETPFYVGTYMDGNGKYWGHGAAVLALPEVIHEFCVSHGFSSVYILPSSTEEVLFLNMTAMDNDSVDVNELSSMVNEINLTTVDPTLRLDPVIYFFDDNTQQISIVSVYAERDKIA